MLLTHTSQPDAEATAAIDAGDFSFDADHRPLVQVVFSGHVDHGKSTVIGRLLADTGSLPHEKVASLSAYCERHSKPFEYAFLLDALKDERAQGITIDSARAFLRTASSRFVVIDAPGHVEFLKNMVSGAARADAAVMVIDVAEGVRENSRRHGYLLSMLGIRQVIVVANKMDLVQYRQEAFDAVADEYLAFLDRVGIRPREIIPAAARAGENIIARGAALDWYRGPTLLEALEALQTSSPSGAAPLRLPVQGIYKFTARGDTRRIVAGTVESGSIQIGDRLTFYPSGKSTTVATIERFNRPAATRADAGEATGFTMTEQVYVARGEVATRTLETPPTVTSVVHANVFWLGKVPLIPGKVYQLKLATSRTPAHVSSINRVIDASTLDMIPGASQVGRHQVAECTFQLSRPVALDLPTDVSPLGRFVIVDDYEIAGGGIIQHAADGREPAIRSTGPAVTSTSRRRGAVLWFTGLSGSGKTTIASYVARELEYQGVDTEYLDGDAIRTFFPATGFGREDREAHVRRIAFLASRLERHGIVVLTALISPYAASRAFARAMCRNFIEIHVSTPLEVCEARDVKGLYARARRGEVPHFTGVDDPYEAPVNPELAIETTSTPVEEAARRVLDRLQTAIRPGAEEVLS